MVHELLGIHNGRVDLSGVPEISKELRVSNPSDTVLSIALTSHYRKSPLPLPPIHSFKATTLQLLVTSGKH